MDIGVTLSNLARAMVTQHRVVEAERCAREAVLVFRRGAGAGHPWTSVAEANLALVRLVAAQPDEARVRWTTSATGRRSASARAPTIGARRDPPGRARRDHAGAGTTCSVCISMVRTPFRAWGEASGPGVRSSASAVKYEAGER